MLCVLHVLPMLSMGVVTTVRPLLVRGMSIRSLIRAVRIVAMRVRNAGRHSSLRIELVLWFWQPSLKIGMVGGRHFTVIRRSRGADV